MQRTEPANFAESIARLPALWNRFWFASIPPSSIRRVTQAFAIFAALIFINDFFWVPQWLSSDGWYGLEAGKYFIGQGRPGTGSQFRWSFLYWLGTPTAAQVLCLFGLLCSILLFLGVANRLASIGAWAGLMMIHQRAPWLSMPAEVLASAGLFYLTIAPGVSRATTALGADRKVDSGSKNYSGLLTNLSLRCLQVHWLIWIGLTLANMLQQTAWWDGTALAILSEQGSGWLGRLSGESTTSQIVGFLVIANHIAVLICLCNPSLRGAGILFTATLGLAYLLIAGDWLLCVASWSFNAAFVPYLGPSTATETAVVQRLQDQKI